MVVTIKDGLKEAGKMKNINWAKATFFLILFLVSLLMFILVIERLIEDSNNREDINNELCGEKGWTYSSNERYDCLDDDGQPHVLLNKAKIASSVWVLILFIVSFLTATSSLWILLYIFSGG